MSLLQSPGTVAALAIAAVWIFLAVTLTLRGLK